MRSIGKQWKLVFWIHWNYQLQTEYELIHSCCYCFIVYHHYMYVCNVKSFQPGLEPTSALWQLGICKHGKIDTKLSWVQSVRGNKNWVWVCVYPLPGTGVLGASYMYVYNVLWTIATLSLHCKHAGVGVLYFVMAGVLFCWTVNMLNWYHMSVAVKKGVCFDPTKHTVET